MGLHHKNPPCILIKASLPIPPPKGGGGKGMDADPSKKNSKIFILKKHKTGALFFLV
jgi:hypothetical protein